MKTKTRFVLTLAITLMLLVGITGAALAMTVHVKHASLDDHQGECTGKGGMVTYWHFVITQIEDDAPASIHVIWNNGNEADVALDKVSGGTAHYETYLNPGALVTDATAWVPDDWSGQFNLSHVTCEYMNEELTVSKTADTSYTRTHAWDIAKAVDPTALYLYIPGQGGAKPSTGTAAWTVDVTYMGYADSDWNVSGEITIENTGTLDAVITSVDDMLDGTAISVYCGVTFPYTLAVGGTLTCTYDEDGYVEGMNEVTVTTERDTYSDDAAIVWGDPTTELYATVTIEDSVAGYLGEVTAPNNATFTYDKTFNWNDYGMYGCGDYTYENTATIFETGQSASATLNVYVQCHIYETAYGKGPNATCFIPKFANWGWTNYLAARGATQTWNLWAAAGKCDTSKGTLVGSVTVVYGLNGYVNVTYNVAMPYIIRETHVYAGYTQFPKVGKNFTVAPGQYTNVGPFSGPIYVIAHAVVGIPDPYFGP